MIAPLPDPANSLNPAVQQAYHAGAFNARQQAINEADVIVRTAEAELSVTKSRLVRAQAEAAESRRLLSEWIEIQDALGKVPRDSLAWTQVVDQLVDHVDEVRVYLKKHVS